MNRRGHTLTWALAIAALLFSSLVSARMFFEEEGIESSTSDIRLPASANGYVVVRACDDCDEITLRLDDETSCVVNNERVSYRELQQRAQSPANPLNIFYHPETRLVTRITLNGSFANQ